MINITHAFTIDTLSEQWAVYVLYDGTGKVHYIGHIRLTQLFTISDARANALFKETLQGITVYIRVTDIVNSKAQALNAHAERTREYGGIPHMTIHGTSTKLTTVICNETGERFNSMNEVVRKHGVSLSQLSHHIRGTAGHKTVKGKTYARVTA